MRRPRSTTGCQAMILKLQEALIIPLLNTTPKHAVPLPCSRTLDAYIPYRPELILPWPIRPANFVFNGTTYVTDVTLGLARGHLFVEILPSSQGLHSCVHLRVTLSTVEQLYIRIFIPSEQAFSYGPHSFRDVCMAKLNAIYKPFSSSRHKFQTGICLNRVFQLPVILHGSSPISFSPTFCSNFSVHVTLGKRRGDWAGVGFLTGNKAADVVGHCALKSVIRSRSR